MWPDFWGVHPLVWWGLGLAGFGALLVLGVALVEAGFKRQWELPPEPDTLPARYAAGRFPELRVPPPPPPPPPPAEDLVTTQEWRDWDAARRTPRPGRHRWRNIGEDTRLIASEEMDRVRWREASCDHD